jgi:beta-galactosidase beta subunit
MEVKHIYSIKTKKKKGKKEAVIVEFHRLYVDVFLLYKPCIPGL